MKERKIIKEKNQGITLIALIITIIILLILSSVSIGVIIKGDFFNKAQDTVGKANSGTGNQNNQEENVKNVWDALPGKIIKSGTKVESGIEFTVTTSNITRTSFRVHAKGTNKNSDILTFVLKVGETIYTEQTGEEVYWDVTGLTPNTKYQFEVIARDARTENRVIGSEITLANDSPQLTVTVSNITPTGATITATGTDGDGDTLMYVLKINGTQYGEIKTGTSGTAVSWDVTNLRETTTYTYTVEVNDPYDTITKSATFTTGTSNTAPVIVTNALSGKTSTTFTIKMKATDSDGDNLIYELYRSTSQNGTYTKVATSSITAQNVQITLDTTGLTEYTIYWWYITVTDGTTITTGDKQSVRTYCPGTGSSCSLASRCYEYENVEKDCPNCVDGYTPCSGTYEVTCSASSSFLSCNFCGKTFETGDWAWYLHCSVCGAIPGGNFASTPVVCTSCSDNLKTNSDFGKTCGIYNVKCTNCENGTIIGRSDYCPTHSGASYGHYWCSTHAYNCGSGNTHTCCVHSRITQHDD